MRVACPSCNAEHALEALLTREADARAVAALVEHSLAFGALVLRYVALFRPGKRRLGLERMATLVNELLPDIERGAITRKGREWPTTQDTWRAALETMLAARDKGTLGLPLTSHGYLYEVLCGLADKAEAQAERATEAERRHRGGVLSDAPAPAAVTLVIAAPPPAYQQGPSRAALKLQQQIAAAQVNRAGMPKEEPAP